MLFFIAFIFMKEKKLKQKSSCSQKAKIKKEEISIYPISSSLLNKEEMEMQDLCFYLINKNKDRGEELYIT